MLRKSLLAACFCLAAQPATAVKISGNVDAQWAYYPETTYAEQHESNLSFAGLVEFYFESESRNDSITFTPFYRYDEHDEERSHGDIRELVWIHVGDFYESRIGISKVFWGVTESQHLVDIINQTDFVEAVDGEEKLGQTMINVTFSPEFGIIDLFVLPGFRERTFAGSEGRLRPPLPISNDKALYESGAEDKHIDLAARWSQSFNDLDLAVSYFDGTSREAIVSQGNVILNGFIPVGITPYYAQIQQWGLEAQWLAGDWTWKLEAIYRDSDAAQFDDQFASTAGFEYTLYGVFESDADLGILLEYHYDNRSKANLTSALENDVFIGTRLAFNDAQSTDLLAGVIVDADYHSQSWFLEASRRFGDSIKLNLEARIYDNVDAEDTVLSFIEKEDFIQAELQWFY